MRGDRILVIGAALNFMIAALHLIIIFIGGSAYRYFGAGEEMASMDEAGSYTPALITLAITCFFCLFGFYALSGAGKIKKLPLTKVVLILITIIFILRGIGVIGDAYMMTQYPMYPSQMIWFSVVALITGICYAIGLRSNWSQL